MTKTMNLNKNLYSYLCPPGSGVFTVNTAKEHKDVLQKKLYGESNDITKSWQESLKGLDDQRGALMLGICSDCGGGIQRGANWGPLYLRNQIIQAHESTKYFDIGDVRVIPHLLHDKYLNEQTLRNCKEALYEDKESELPVSPLSISKKCCDDIYENIKDVGIFSIGGDHSVSYPIVKSWLEHKNRNNIKAAIIHFDAHTDLLVTRLGIDLCFGSWLTHVLPDLSDPKLCYQFGIRSTGKDRNHWENQFGIHQYWTREVKEIGPLKLIDKVIKELKDNGVQEVYISFDIDALDSKFAAATGTPEPEGLEPHECVIMIDRLAEELKVTGGDVVEIAPRIGDEQNSKRTLECGAIIASRIIEAINSAYS